MVDDHSFIYVFLSFKFTISLDKITLSMVIICWTTQRHLLVEKVLNLSKIGQTLCSQFQEKAWFGEVQIIYISFFVVDADHDNHGHYGALKNI